MIKALGQPAAARLNEKLRKCIVSSTSYSNTRLTDIGNILEGPLPSKLVTVLYRIAPGKMAEFESLVKGQSQSACQPPRARRQDGRREVRRPGLTNKSVRRPPTAPSPTSPVFAALTETVVRSRIDRLSF